MPEVAELSAKVTADTKDFDAGMKRADAGIARFVSGAGRIGGSLGGVATTVGVAATALGGLAVAGFGAVIKTSSEFSHSMSEVGAATQATGEELTALRGLSLALGKDIQLAGVDATDAAQAIAELGRGGVSVGQLLDGAAKGGLLLFSAGADNVGQATDVAITAMANFGKTGAEIPHVADVIAAAAGKSATSVGQLGAAFNQSAAVASGAGITFEELSGTLAFLAQRGLQGSDAGTSLKTALQRLQAPTDEAATLMASLGINVRDAEGHMLPLAGIADVLKARLGGLSDAQRDAALQTLGGADAIRVLLPLMQGGGDAIREWTAKVDDAGYAARIGAQKNDDLRGSFSQLQATIQTAAIEVGTKFEPALRKATDAGAKFLTDFLANPAVQRGLDRFAADFATGLDTIIAKLGDPAFQTQMKGWATALLDTGKAAASLAGTVRDVVGPPLLAAVGWFNDLDEGGKRNVVMFGLVAGAALKFGDELGTLLTVGNKVVTMFGEKLAAKKLLNAANGNLATSAGKTATAFGLVRAGAAVATPAIALGTAAVILATGAWTGIVAGMVKYRDATGETARMQDQFTVAMTASQFAQEHGATALNDHVAGFVRWIDASRTSVKTTDEMAAAWNRYLNTVTLGGNSTAGLTLALTAQQQAQQGVNKYLGEGLIAGYAFNDMINVQAGAARSLAGTIAAGLAAQQAQSDAQERYALALQDTNGVLTPYQAAQAAANLQVAQTGLNLQLAEARTLAAAQAMAIAEQDTGEFGTQVGLLRNSLLTLTLAYDSSNQALAGLNGENSRLGSYLQVLQGEWDKLNVATKDGKNVTAEQKAEYERLAPAIQYLNGVMGENNKGVIDNILKLVGLEGQLKNTGVSYSTAAAAAQGTFGAAMKAAGTDTQIAAVALAAAEGAAKVFGGSANSAATAANSQAGAARTQAGALDGTAAAAVKASGAVSGLAAAINFVPKSFTVVAHVDISQALANIATLSNNIPRSPAKEGPFRKLPDWMALYDQLAPAGDWAIATLGQTTGAMSAALKGAVDEGAKTAAEIASAVARAVQDVIGAGGALSKVNPTSGPSGAQFSWLTATTTALVGSLQAAAASFKADGLKATGEFADVAGRVGGSVKGTLEGLAALAGYDFARSSPTGSAMAWFTHLATSLVANFARAAQMFGEGLLKDASDLADSAGKVGGSIKGTLEGLQALAGANWAKSSPSGSAMGWFTHLAASLVANFAVAAAGFAEGALKSASELADSASKVGGSVKNVMEGLAALANADWAKVSPSGSAMSWLTHLVTSLVQTYAAAAATFETGALDGAAKLGESVGKVAGSIGPTLAGLKDIATGVAVPSAGQLDAFFAGVRAVFARFAEMAKTLDGEATEQVGKFATSANSVMGAAKSATDLFRAFAPDKDGKNGLVIPSAKGIDDLAIGIAYVVAKFRDMAGMLVGEGLKAVTDFAAGAGQIVGVAKSGADLFKTLAETKTMPTNAVIDYLVGSIGYLITQTRTVAAGIGTEGLLQAQQFATGTLTFVTTVKNALELFPKLAELKGLPGKALEEILGAMGAALELAKQNVNVATDILGQSQTYLDIMREAASNFAQGLALGNGIPAGSALGTALAAPASVPALAAGGIVTKPTLALIGEAGPEAVVPLSQLGRAGRSAGGGGGGGAIYVTIEYHDHTMQGTDRARLADFARSLKPELEKVVVASW